MLAHTEGGSRRRGDTGRMSRLTVRPGDLEDDVLLLRQWEKRDVPALVAALADPEIPRWVLTIPSPYTSEHAADFLRFAAEQRSSEKGAHLGVFARGESGETLAGGASLAPVDWPNRSAQIGYWTAGSFRNRGVARGAVRLLVDWAFGRLGLERVGLTCDPANVGSRRVAEAAGFQLEGRMRGHLSTPDGRRDSLVYGLLVSDRG